LSLNDKNTEKKALRPKQSVSITEEANRRIYRFVRDGAVGEYLQGMIEPVNAIIRHGFSVSFRV